MKKHGIWILLLAALALSIGCGTTLAAYLSSSAGVHNTFTAGNVSIKLEETTGAEYIIAPGITLPKDPTLTVLSGSESCWLFVKVEKMPNFDAYCTFELEDGWITLPENDGVYYRQVGKAQQDQPFQILKNNCVLVNASVTEEMLAAITKNPALVFTGYAAQSLALATPQEAWQVLQGGRGE